jgi:hypothetical protein
MRQPRLFEVEIPDDIRPAVDAWLAYKAKRRQSYKTAEGLAALVERMVEMGAERSAAAVRWSMSNNYAGLYEEPKRNGKAPGGLDLPPPAWAAEIMTPSETEGWPFLSRSDRSFFLDGLAIIAARRRAELRESLAPET